MFVIYFASILYVSTERSPLCICSSFCVSFLTG